MSVRGYSCGDSILLFVPWGPVFLRKCKDTFMIFLSLMSPSAWRLWIVTDGCASSDWSPGPMLVCVHLGDICVVIGSSLMFLLFFVYVLIRKVGHICFIITVCQHFREPRAESKACTSDFLVRVRMGTARVPLALIALALPAFHVPSS